MNLPPIEQRPWFTIAEACTQLGLTPKTGRNQMSMRTFPVPWDHIGRTPVVYKDVLSEFFERGKQKGLAQLKQKGRG